jgi:hypothetical protein
MRKAVYSLTAAAALLCLSSVAHAQATRTWVSGVGDDANPCSRTAPCKTFAGAISKTASGGEINVLDPGGFGAVTITKAISIIGDGNIAGVLVSGTNGIVISAGANDMVTLRNLDINGLGTGLSGIKFLAGKGLHVQNCRIYGFTGAGIDFDPNQLGAVLEVQDTILTENANGILVAPATGGNAKVGLDRVHSTNNSGDGFKTDATNGAIAATVRESVFMTNGGNGIHSFSPGAGLSRIMVDHCSVQNQSSNSSSSVGNGIFSDTGSGSTIFITDNTISGNVTGVFFSGSATITSFGNNHNGGNVSPGSPNP